MEIAIQYNGIDWLIVVDDYDYHEEEPETGPSYASGGEPGCPEYIDINEYHLQMEKRIFGKELTEAINDQLLESNKLGDHIFDKQSYLINDLALEIHNNEFE